MSQTYDSAMKDQLNSNVFIAASPARHLRVNSANMTGLVQGRTQQKSQPFMNNKLISRKRKSRSGVKSAARIFSGTGTGNQGFQYEGQPLNIQSNNAFEKSKFLKSASAAKSRPTSNIPNEQAISAFENTDGDQQQDGMHLLQSNQKHFDPSKFISEDFL